MGPLCRLLSPLRACRWILPRPLWLNDCNLTTNFITAGSLRPTRAFMSKIRRMSARPKLTCVSSGPAPFQSEEREHWPPSLGHHFRALQMSPASSSRFCSCSLCLPAGQQQQDRKSTRGQLHSGLWARSGTCEMSNSLESSLEGPSAAVGPLIRSRRRPAACSLCSGRQSPAVAKALWRLGWRPIGPANGMGWLCNC